jgi:hypothetical protein
MNSPTKKKKNTRRKGLDYVREGRLILGSLGFKVCGPGYKVMRFRDKRSREVKPIQVHEDYFGCFDLITYDTVEHRFEAHQFSDVHNRMAKVRLILGMGFRDNVFVWARDLINRLVAYRVMEISNGEVHEREEIHYLKDFVAKETATDDEDAL